MSVAWTSMLKGSPMLTAPQWRPGAPTAQIGLPFAVSEKTVRAMPPVVASTGRPPPAATTATTTNTAASAAIASSATARDLGGLGNVLPFLVEILQRPNLLRAFT